MKIRTILVLGVLAVILAVLSWWVGQQSYSWFPPQASAEAKLIDKLFSFLVTIGTFIFLGVVGTLTYSVLFQQAGKYDTSDGPHIEGNVTLEVVWTIIPFVLVIWIATYSYQIYDQMSILGPMEHIHMGMAVAQADPVKDSNDLMGDQKPTEEIEVYARQWVWEFRYPQHNITSTELHIPSNQRVKLTLHSEDVIHGFYIPAFRVKQDIIPGRVIDFEFTPILEGSYRLRDSQYSGTYFAAMQSNVLVESPQVHQEWLLSAAANAPITGYNQAFESYHNSHKALSAGWKSIEPAAPPLVNYPSP